MVGARPQFVKLAPVACAMKDRAHHAIVHTGQHYDENMSGSFFRELALPEPTLNLGIPPGSHAQQTAAILSPLERFLESEKPDWVLIYGDTNSTLGGALVAAKLGIPIAHLEAGLRSGNRGMPEEINRIVADHLADLNLAPSEGALSHLFEEGLAGRSELVGDVMVDSLNFAKSRLGERLRTKHWLETPGDYLIATLHRQELTSSRQKLVEILTALANHSLPVYLPAHPRLKKAIERFGLLESVRGSLRLVPPLGYLDLIDAVADSRGVLTDSGGLQKEAYLLEVPCLTLRPETEWVETLHGGWNRLVWSNFSALSEFPPKSAPEMHNPDVFGDGKVAPRVVSLLLSHCR